MGNVHMEATQINYRGGSKKMSVEEAIKAAGTEITPEEKTWIDSIPALATSNAGKTDQDVIAPEFDAEAGTYAIGDLVMHEGKLYEFTSAHETAGDWNAEEVSEKTVSDELDTLKSGLTGYYAAHVKSVTKQLTVSDDVNHVISFGISLPNIVVGATTDGNIICPNGTYADEWLGIVLGYDGTKVTSGTFNVTIYYLDP